MSIKYFYLFIVTYSFSFLFSDSKVIYGSIEHLEFHSDIIGKRKVEIYSPNNFIIDNKTIFIFAQDGQTMFDSSKTWNSQEWGIDEIFSIRETNKNIILIAVHSANISGDGFYDNTMRYAEYFPKQSLEYFDNNIKTFIYKKFIDRKKFDYLSFIVNELKPFIENKYNVNLDKSNTGILGASMGALFSLNALIEYPDIFGFAGCFSVHWIGIKPIDYFLLPFRMKVTEDKDLVKGLIKYIDSNIDNLDDHKLYFDFGTESLDQYYSQPQKKIDKIFKDNKKTFKTLKFDGHSHEEKYWSLRFESALDFLIAK